MINKQIKQATTIKAREDVGLMNNSKFQVLTLGSIANIINYELGIIGVQILIDLFPSIENAALKLST